MFVVDFSTRTVTPKIPKVNEQRETEPEDYKTVLINGITVLLTNLFYLSFNSRQKMFSRNFLGLNACPKILFFF